MLDVRATGLVYRNPRPELRSRHTWHPTLTRFDDGELLVTFDIAEADVVARLPDVLDAFDRRRRDLDIARARGPGSARPPDDPVGAARRGCPTGRSWRWVP